MNITAIYSTPRREKSSTYQLTQRFIENLSKGDAVKTFFLPKDMPEFCCGCFQCIRGHEEKCPAYKYMKPITESMDASDLIIFAVPTYVYHVPGTMKALLDHFAYRWMIHRPNGKMFKKQVLAVSTAAGAGMKTTVKDVKDSADYWGVGRFYAYKKAVFGANWHDVRNKEKYLAQVDKLSAKIMREHESFHTGLKAKAMFTVFRAMQKKSTFSETDSGYWLDMGWLGKERPWK